MFNFKISSWPSHLLLVIILLGSIGGGCFEGRKKEDLPNPNNKKNENEADSDDPFIGKETKHKKEKKYKKETHIDKKVFPHDDPKKKDCEKEHDSRDSHPFDDLSFYRDQQEKTQKNEEYEPKELDYSEKDTSTNSPCKKNKPVKNPSSKKSSLSNKEKLVVTKKTYTSHNNPSSKKYHPIKLPKLRGMGTDIFPWYSIERDLKQLLSKRNGKKGLNWNHKMNKYKQELLLKAMEKLSDQKIINEMQKTQMYLLSLNLSEVKRYFSSSRLKLSKTSIIHKNYYQVFSNQPMPYLINNNAVMIDFANKHLGGGAPFHGFVQEEMLSLVAPAIMLTCTAQRGWVPNSRSFNHQRPLALNEAYLFLNTPIVANMNPKQQASVGFRHSRSDIQSKVSELKKNIHSLKKPRPTAILAWNAPDMKRSPYSNKEEQWFHLFIKELISALANNGKYTITGAHGTGDYKNNEILIRLVRFTVSDFASLEGVKVKYKDYTWGHSTYVDQAFKIYSEARNSLKEQHISPTPKELLSKCYEVALRQGINLSQPSH